MTGEPSTIDIRVRRAQPADLPFIMRSWLESYGRGSPHTVLIPKLEFFPGHREIIDELLARDGCQLLVACDNEDHQVLLGFICTELTDICHYAYVKKTFRRLGIAGMLAAVAGLVNPIKASHWSYDAARVSSSSKIYKIIFNPYKIRG